MYADGVGDTNPDRVPLLGVAEDIVATGEGCETVVLVSPIWLNRLVRSLFSLVLIVFDGDVFEADGDVFEAEGGGGWYEYNP